MKPASTATTFHQSTIKRGLLALLVAALIASTMGCMRVIRQEAPYYTKGPQQPDPPNGFFEPGTKVWVLGQKDSYSRVLTLDGIAGHVWSQDLLTLGQWQAEQEAAEGTEWE